MPTNIGAIKGSLKDLAFYDIIFIGQVVRYRNPLICFKCGQTILDINMIVALKQGDSENKTNFSHLDCGI